MFALSICFHGFPTIYAGLSISMNFSISSEPGWKDFELRVPEARRQLVRRKNAVVEAVGVLRAKNLGIQNWPRPEHVPKNHKGFEPRTF